MFALHYITKLAIMGYSITESIADRIIEQVKALPPFQELAHESERLPGTRERVITR